MAGSGGVPRLVGSSLLVKSGHGPLESGLGLSPEVVGPRHMFEGRQQGAHSPQPLAS